MKKIFFALIATAAVAAVALVFTSCSSEPETKDVFQVGIYSDSPALEVSEEMTWYLAGFTKTFNVFYFVDAEKKVMLEMTPSEAKKRYDKWQKDICEALKNQQTDTVAVVLGVGGCPSSGDQDLIDAANRLFETYKNTPADKLIVFGVLQTSNDPRVKETNFSLSDGKSVNAQGDPEPPENDRNHNIFLDDTLPFNQANQTPIRMPLSTRE